VKKISASGKIQIDIEPAIKAIIFDFDDTIEVFKKAKESTHKKIAERMLKDYGVYPDTTLKMMDEIDRKFALAGIGASTSNYDRHNWFKEYFSKIGRKASVSEIDTMTNLYWRFIIEAATPMPYAIETLKKIKEDYKIAVISDSDGEVRIKTERAKTVGVYPLVELFITSDETGKNKPNKALYEKVFAKFNVGPGECVMVGDKPQVDLKLAKELGMKTVWMKHGDWAKEFEEDHFSYVDYEITDLRQIIEILKEI
jgi:putative hydrolase of the HAD superfamily